MVQDHDGQRASSQPRARPVRSDGPRGGRIGSRTTANGESPGAPRKRRSELDDGVPAPPLSVKILDEMPLKLGDRRDCPGSPRPWGPGDRVSRRSRRSSLIRLDGKIATKIMVASRSRTRDDLPPLGQHLIEGQVADDRIDLVVRSRRETAEDTVGGDSVSRCWRAKAWSGLWGGGTAKLDTVTSAAKPEVSFDGSVAVALIDSPTGTEVLENDLEARRSASACGDLEAAQVLLALTVARRIGGLVGKELEQVDGTGGKAGERADNGGLLVRTDGRGERRWLGILIAVAAEVDAQIAVRVDRIGQDRIELGTVGDRDSRPSVELNDIAAATEGRATDRVMACIILDMDAILGVTQQPPVYVIGGADIICLPPRSGWRRRSTGFRIGHWPRSRSWPRRSCRLSCRRPS